MILRVSPMSFAGYTVNASGIADQSCYANLVNQTSARFQGPPVAVEPDGESPAFALAPPSPNPARGRTTLAFTIPAAAEVSLALFDASGRLVRSLARGPFAAGRHSVTLDGRDSNGRHLAPGLYFVRISAGLQTRVQRLVVMP